MTVQRFYTIRIQGHRDPGWSDRLQDLTIAHDPDGLTVLAGPLRDQAALFGVLIKIRDLGLTLVSVNQIEPGKPRHF